MKTIRKAIGLIFIFIGASWLKAGEFIGGNKYAYRSQELLTIFREKTTAKCSRCGHEGNLTDCNPPKDVRDHHWVFYKKDKFRSCLKCNMIERDDKKYTRCTGKTVIAMRVAD